MTRFSTEAVLAVLFAAAMILAGGAVFYFVSTISPAHTDPGAVPSTAAAAPAERYSGSVEEARRLARALLVDENLPGLSVAVALDGRIVWAEGFGWADVERRAMVTPLTRFRIGGVSKPLTAAAAGLLHERRPLDLDAPVQQYVPARSRCCRPRSGSSPARQPTTGWDGTSRRDARRRARAPRRP